MTANKDTLSRAKAIRKFCLGCCCGSAAEVRKCGIDDCPLHEFRFGPGRSGNGIESKGEFVAHRTKNGKNSVEAGS